jgi:hypothetical protein
MRKLTLLATTAIAALALAAAAAPAANADRAFTMVHPASGGLPCNPCYDIGYAGDFDLENTSTGIYQATCNTQFNIRFEANGSLETYNTVVDGCNVGNLIACDDSWTGQMRVPDTGPAQIDLEICLENPIGQQTTQDITFTAYNNPRRLEQLTEDPQYPSTIVDALFTDGYAADNVQVQLQ